jgi:hypothetical protein
MPSWKRDMALPSLQVMLLKRVMLDMTVMPVMPTTSSHRDCQDLRDFPGRRRKSLQGRRRGFPGPLTIPSRRWCLSLHTHRRDSQDLPTIQGHRWTNPQYPLRGCPGLRGRPNFPDPRRLNRLTNQGRRARKTRTMKVPETRRSQRALPMQQQTERQSTLQREQQRTLQMEMRM